MKFLEGKITKFLIPKSLTWLSAGRPDRSTEAEVGRPDRSTDVHRCARSPGWEAGRPGWSTTRELLLSGNGPGRPPGRPQRALLSVSSFRSTGGLTVIIMTIGWSTARSTGKAVLPFARLPTGRICWGYKYPPFELVFNNNFKRKKSSSS